MKKLLREPLIHFMLIGVGLFLVFGLIRTPVNDASKRVVVTVDQVEQLAAQFSGTWMRQPNADEMAGLIANHVRDEVYYREAVAMGLDQNDQLIRRRMRQKLEFILEDLTAAEASEEALAAFLRQHPDKFRIEPQVSFRQLYLNPDKHPDMAGDAAEILAQLRAGTAAETLGDRTMVRQDYTLAMQSEIARNFGELFARQVVSLTPGTWMGPFYSGLGGHLVLVTERREGRLPELDEIRATVEREYTVQRREELKDIAYKKLLEGYEVVIQTPATEGDKAGTAIAATRPGETGK